MCLLSDFGCIADYVGKRSGVMQDSPLTDRPVESRQASGDSADPWYKALYHGRRRRSRGTPAGSAPEAEHHSEGATASRRALEDRARARWRRLHGRRLRDRRAAGARPAERQPHRQRLRHLRRHQRRVFRGQPAGGRSHARRRCRGWSTGRCRRRSATSTWARCCGPTTPTSRLASPADATAAGRPGTQPCRPLARGLADGRVHRSRRGASAGLYTGAGSRTTSASSSTRATARTTSGCSRPSCT